MARVPIEINRIIKESYRFGDKSEGKREEEQFLIEIEEKRHNWNLTHITNRKELLRLRDAINGALGYNEVAKSLNCTINEAETIVNYQHKEKICNNCAQKNIACYDCIFTCQSPLEQKLYVALKNRKIDTELQWRIRKDGSGYPKKYPVNKKTILTLPDFYIEASGKKVCIYADGHTYHERTESQALRDRNIDRELQNFGYVCLRFTGKEIRENIDKEKNGCSIRLGAYLPYRMRL
ncbi:DUF559 domain-containing protein [Marixanthomonas spongiae]|uniref:DUF559 domain-containing protein n=1 Tax=Marixanthomonas spongiae TaxID=2174845 RepID=A0A2U0HWF7_9FLAO|nr:DUF559 domain-containing protein [Marixanthomonas spongiae]PVW13168.1 hypothetical protein DDV96_13755 [Marixanthomonas spongiae]